MVRNPISVALVILAFSIAAFAHHSVSAEYDNSKPLEFTGGVVKVVEWVNPHIYTQVEVKDPQTGKLVTYRIEGTAPNGLFRNGWKKDSVKPGTIVSFKGTRAKNPSSSNAHGELVLPDGKIAWSGTPPAAAY